MKTTYMLNKIKPSLTFDYTQMYNYHEPMIEAIYMDRELIKQQQVEQCKKYSNLEHFVLNTHNNYRTIYRHQAEDPIIVVPIRKPTKQQQRQGIQLNENTCGIKLDCSNGLYQQMLHTLYDSNTAQHQNKQSQQMQNQNKFSTEISKADMKLQELFKSDHSQSEPKTSTQDSSFLISSETKDNREAFLRDLDLSDLSDTDFQENEYDGSDTEKPMVQLSLANWREVAISQLLNSKTKWRDMWGKPSTNLSFEMNNEKQNKNVQNSIRKVQSAGTYTTQKHRIQSRTKSDGIQTINARKNISAENIVCLLDKLQEKTKSTGNRSLSQFSGQISIWNKHGTGKTYDPYLNDMKVIKSSTPSFFKAPQKEDDNFQLYCNETKQRRIQSCKERLVVQPQAEIARAQMRRFKRQCQLCGRKVSIGFQSRKNENGSDYVCVGCGQYIEVKV